MRIPNKQQAYWSILGLALLGLGALFPVTLSSTFPDTKEEKIQGFSWEGLDSLGAQQIKTIEPYGVNWIAHTPFAYQASIDQPELRYFSRRGNGGTSERDQRLSLVVKVAKAEGVQTLLKPHIWPGRDAGGWRSDIKMKSEADWTQWFENYGAYILHNAALAEELEIPMFCIGTELYLTAKHREQDWRNLIAEVRKVYSGKITYAANFYKEYEEIQFWDALDYIGIQAYFPLCDKENPSLEDLKAGWEPHYKKIKKQSKKWNKPVLFTELGYRSMADAAIEPWVWPDRLDYETHDISRQTQAKCYEAFFQTFWKEKWVGGVFFWKWSRRQYYPERYAQRRRRREHKDTSPIDFSPKEEGLKVIQEWFSNTD